jgi:hypothetical protein
MTTTTMEETLAGDAQARGATDEASYWRELAAYRDPNPGNMTANAIRHDGHGSVMRYDDPRLDSAPAPAPRRHPGAFPPGHDRSSIIGAIEGMIAARGTRADSAERLSGKSDAYLVARFAALTEWGIRERKQGAAHGRADAAGVVRLDSTPNDRDLSAARARVFHSGVPQAEAEAVAQQLARGAAWQRARDSYLAESTQHRLDSMDANERAPTSADLAAARFDLAGRVPLDASARADAFAAAALESAIQARAREHADRRIAAEHRRDALARLPPPPPMPHLLAASRAVEDAERAAVPRIGDPSTDPAFWQKPGALGAR